MLRNAEIMVRMREFHASLPFLQKWTDELVGEHQRSMAALADGARSRRCRARRRDGGRCKCWAIRGGFVCRMHGGAAPQVRAKARTRGEAAKLYRQMAVRTGR